MKKRRLISVILCMIMILQLTPMVFAEDVEERNPEDYLISKWDFEGSDLETQLADKAEKGSTSDPVELVGEGIVIENGVMKIPTTAKTYARVKCPEGSDQYSMANKTVIFRAKISEVTEGSTLVAGIFGKAGLWNVYFANAKIRRALSLHYVKFDKDTGETSSQTICPTSLDQENCFPTTTDVYLTYAATTVFDEENGTAVTTFYRSNVENPTSAEDFVVLSSGTYTVDASAKLSSENDLIIGKRFGDISKDRMLNSAFTDIMIYDTILTEQEIVRVSSGLKEAETSDTSEEPDLSTALDRHLVSHYDFEGETLDERYADKATVGVTRDSLKPVNKKQMVVANGGTAYVPGDGGHLLYTASDDIRNVYSMTFYSKLKWNYTTAGNPNTAFADLMFYEKLFRIFKQGTNDASAPAIFEARAFGTSTTVRAINDKLTVAEGEWFWIALSMEIDSENQATAVLYLSNDGFHYTSVSATYKFTDEELATLNANMNAATKKIYNGYTSARNVDYTFDDIRFYDVALTEEELISICTPVYLQRKLGDENDIRVLCMLPENIAESCQGIGFVFATSADALVIGGEKVADSGIMKTLYAGVRYTDGTGTHTVTAAKHGSYGFAVTVLGGIPADKLDTLIYFRPYIVNGDGSISYGKISAFTVNEIPA